jgi:hypothetical protein
MPYFISLKNNLMKKFVIVCTIIILSGLSCKKICACDPAQAALFLVIKNAAGQDIFDPSTPNSFTKDQVSLIAETPTGKSPLPFYIRRPEEWLGLNNYFIYVSSIAAAVSFSPEIHLKLGNQNQYTLNITITKDGRRIEQLLIDGKNIPASKKPDLLSLFYFSQ